MARPLDPTIDRAITEATLTLLRERGFARMSMEAVASRAGVGKPAIYRRFRDKAELVATVIDTQLPQLELPDAGDARHRLHAHPGEPALPKQRERRLRDGPVDGGVEWSGHADTITLPLRNVKCRRRRRPGPVRVGFHRLPDRRSR